MKISETKMNLYAQEMSSVKNAILVHGNKGKDFEVYSRINQYDKHYNMKEDYFAILSAINNMVDIYNEFNNNVIKQFFYSNAAKKWYFILEDKASE